jgi:hypothetical protein
MVRGLLWIAVVLAAIVVVAMMVTPPTPPKRQVVTPPVGATRAFERLGPELTPSPAIEQRQAQTGDRTVSVALGLFAGGVLAWISTTRGAVR